MVSRETIADMLCGLSRETPGEAGKSWETCGQSDGAELSDLSGTAALRRDWDG